MTFRKIACRPQSTALVRKYQGPWQSGLSEKTYSYHWLSPTAPIDSKGDESSQ